MRKDIPRQLNYCGPERHTDVHKLDYIRMMPTSVGEMMLKENQYSRIKEKRESILLTPHPEKYTQNKYLLLYYKK